MILAHLTHRAFVTPDHMSTELGHLEGKAQVSDFFCFGDVGRWTPVISMQRYLDDRRDTSSALAELFPSSSTPRLPGRGRPLHECASPTSCHPPLSKQPDLPGLSRHLSSTWCVCEYIARLSSAVRLTAGTCSVVSLCVCRGVPAGDIVRVDSEELLNFLRNGSTGGSEAHPLWDSDTNVLAVPSIKDFRYTFIIYGTQQWVGASLLDGTPTRDRPGSVGV